MNCGDSLTAEQPVQQEGGGANPTSPLQYQIGKAWQRIIREKHSRKDELFQMTESHDLGKSVVKEISYSQAKSIIIEYEWLASMPHRFGFRVAHGLYCNNNLLGALVYAQPSIRSESIFGKDYGSRSIIQLSRGACIPSSPPNSASFLISKSIILLKRDGVKAIVAYCTPEAGEIGTIYQSCNFHYIGTTPPSYEYFLDNRWVGERAMAHKRKWLNEQTDEKKKRFSDAFSNLKKRQTLPRFRYLYVIDKELPLKLPVHQYPKRGQI